MNEKVAFACNLAKVQNMRDGGFRVTLDMASEFAAQAAMLLVYADQPGVNIHVTLELAKDEEAAGL